MIRAKFTIRHDEESYKKGELINGLSAKEEERLVSINAAEYVISPEEELKVQQVSKPPIDITPEEFEELRAALDDEYNAEELTREAKAVGVDLTGVKGKAATIEAIINQGKADALLVDEDLDSQSEQNAGE